NRLSPVQSDVPRTSHGTPTAFPFEKQQHVVEFVVRLDARENRRISVLLEDHRGGKRAFEAMGAILAQHSAEREARFSIHLPIVRDAPQELLHTFGRTVALHDLPL